MPDLLGGLGNQLFVLAACYWYASSHGGGVILDRSQRKIRSYGKARPSYAATAFRAFPAGSREGFRNVSQAKVLEVPPSASVRLTGGYYSDQTSMRRLLTIRSAFVEALNVPGLEIPVRGENELAVHVRLADASTPESWAPAKAELDQARRVVDSEIATGTRVTVFSNDPATAGKMFPGASVSVGRTELQDLAELASYSRILSVSSSTYLVWSVLLRDHVRQITVPFGSPDGGDGIGAKIRRQHLVQLGEVPWAVIKNALIPQTVREQS